MISKAISATRSMLTLERPMDELTLCRRIAGGERQLFGRVIDQYSGLVAGVIASQGIERSEIEDLAQETFINIYRGIANFRGDAKLSSWIYRIAFNVARHHLRKKATRPTPHSVEEAAEAGRHPIDEHAGSEPLNAVRNRALTGALEQIPVNQRTALHLYYFEELTYEEIAEAMRMNLNTVRTHIRRGKLKLAELLDEETLGI